MDAGSDLCGGEAVARVGCMSAHLVSLAASGSRPGEVNDRSHSSPRVAAASPARDESVPRSLRIGRAATLRTGVRDDDGCTLVLRSDDIGAQAPSRARAVVPRLHGTRVREDDGCSRVLRSNDISAHTPSHSRAIKEPRLHGTRAREHSVNGCLHSIGPCSFAYSQAHMLHISPLVLFRARALQPHPSAVRSSGTDQLARHR